MKSAAALGRLLTLLALTDRDRHRFIGNGDGYMSQDRKAYWLSRFLKFYSVASLLRSIATVGRAD